MTDNPQAVSDSQLHSLMENMPDAAIIADQEGKITYTNSLVNKLFGYSRKELIGEPVEILLPERLREAHLKHRAYYAEFPKIRPMGIGRELIGRRKDGSEFPLEISLAPLGKGEGYDVLCAIRDVTARNQLIKTVREAHSLLSATLEASAEGVISINRSKKITTYNRKFLEMWDVPDEIAESKDFDRILELLLDKLKNPEGFAEGVKQMGKHPEKVSCDVIELKDGRVFEHYCNPQRIGDEIVGNVRSFRDVTENTRLLEELDTNIARLSKKNGYENIISSVNRSVSESADVRSVLESAVEVMSKNVEAADMVMIYFVEGNEAVLKSHRGLPSWYVRRLSRIPHPKGFTWKAIMEGKPILYCADVDTDRAIGPAGRKLGTKSYASMPIVEDGKCIGVVNINSMKKNAFDEEELKLLETVSRQIERALQKARVIEALRQSEERYRVLFDQAPVGVFIFNDEYRVTECNKRMCEILQTSSDNIIGQDMRELKDTNFLPAIEKALEGQSSHLEYKYTTHHSSKELFLSLRVSPLLDKDKSVVGAMGVLSDITERMASEEILSKLSSAVEHAADNIFITDKSGVIEYVNHAFEKSTGYSKHEVIGKTPSILKSGQHDKEFYGEMWRTILSGDVYNGELINKKKNGDLFYEEKTITPLKDSQGNVTHFVSTGKDVTERKQLEAELQQAQRMEAIGRLAGGVAHDFNNLLTVILSYSDMLLSRTKSDERTQASVQEIKNAGLRAAALTDQLLAFSRKKVLQPRVLDLNGVIGDMKKMLKRLITEDIELITALEPALWRVKADAGQIEQVIMNLVVNAGDAMPRGGKLIIETANVYPGEADSPLHTGDEALQLGVIRESHYVMLAVSDTGHGMDEETTSHIFEPFYTTKRSGKGTGLGLATVYGIVNQSGGHVSVYSEVDKGTTFKIYLPRSEGNNENIEKKKSTEKKSLSGTETILVSEDEETVRTIVVKVLKQRGYKILEASDCDDALSICERFSDPIHLFLTDVVMPRVSGPELAERVRELHPEIKVIYMSGYTDNALIHHAGFEEGANFLSKPITPDKLLRKVREVLDQP